MHSIFQLSPPGNTAQGFNPRSGRLQASSGVRRKKVEQEIHAGVIWTDVTRRSETKPMPPLGEVACESGRGLSSVPSPRPQTSLCEPKLHGSPMPSLMPKIPKSPLTTHPKPHKFVKSISPETLLKSLRPLPKGSEPLASHIPCQYRF